MSLGLLALLLQAPHTLAAGGLINIVAVRVWPAAEYTRVTLESDKRLALKRHFLVETPDRLVIDVGSGAQPQSARAAGQGRPTTLHRRRARGPEPADRGAHRAGPEAARGAADLFAHRSPPTSTAWCLTSTVEGRERPGRRAGACPRSRCQRLRQRLRWAAASSASQPWHTRRPGRKP